MKYEIDLMKIGNIKSKATLKHYPLNKPLMNGNYLFHYLILTNNMKGLRLGKHPLFRLNNDGLNALMLAARDRKYKILNYLLDKYKDNKHLIYQKNKKGMNFLYYINPTDKEYLEIINNNPDIDWTSLFETVSTSHISGLELLFLQGKFSCINKIINKFDFNYKSYISQPAHFSIIINSSLNNSMVKELLDNLESKDKNILSYVDDMGYDVSYPIVLNGDIEEVKYIVKKRGEHLDRYSPITTNHLFIIAYKEGVKENDYTIAKYLLDNTMKNHNFDETDMYGSNLAHFILKNRLITRKGDYNIEKDILSRYKHWGRINMDKKSALEYIVNLDFKKYHKFVNNKATNVSSKDKYWNKYISKLPLDKENNNINMVEAPYAHSNMFQARFSDINIFSIYLKEKYKDNKYGRLYMPLYEGDDVTPDWDDDMLLPDNMLNYNNNFPWIIIWNSDEKYWIHPHLNDLINKNKNTKGHYKAAFVFLSLRLPDGGLHASLIFYDFTRNQIQRFDPYGDTSILDGKMDEIFKQKLAKPCKMDYCGPDCYFPVSGFQTLSDENNIMNQKMGDFGGYCLAWSIWYAEHKMINLKVEPKDLIRKTLNRFMKMNIKPMEYIRNYANYISKFRIGYLKKIGIPENLTTNENLSRKFTNVINKSMIEYNHS
uniref:Ankyrin repeat protein n=1 Tax=viral metagenome TaxID=1070528 RepID=A0A6C0HXJ2_9ZZZZ